MNSTSRFSFTITSNGVAYQTEPGCQNKIVTQTKKLLKGLVKKELITEELAAIRYKMIKALSQEIKKDYYKEQAFNLHQKELELKQKQKEKYKTNQPVVDLSELPGRFNIDELKLYCTFSKQRMRRGLPQPSWREWQRLKAKRERNLELRATGSNIIEPYKKQHKLYICPIGTTQRDAKRYRSFACNRINAGKPLPSFSEWKMIKRNI